MTAQLKVASSVPSEEPAVPVMLPEPGAAVASADAVAAAAVVEALAWAVFSETFSMPPVAPQEYQSTA